MLDFRVRHVIVILSHCERKHLESATDRILTKTTKRPKPANETPETIVAGNVSNACDSHVESNSKLALGRERVNCNRREHTCQKIQSSSENKFPHGIRNYSGDLFVKAQVR